MGGHTGVNVLVTGLLAGLISLVLIDLRLRSGALVAGLVEGAAANIRLAGG